MQTAGVIVWLRRDLRLADHPAFTAAARLRVPVYPLYIWSLEAEHPWAPGGASRWWLHHSLAHLEETLPQRGSRLLIRVGNALDVLRDVLQSTGADTIYWSRSYEPERLAIDQSVKATLRAEGYTVRSFNAALWHEPWTIRNKSGDPYQVFTPFWKACLAQPEPDDPLSAPKRLTAPDQWPASDALATLALLPRVKWDAGFYRHWTPGERGAHDQLTAFCDGTVAAYKEARDQPGQSGTSRLSPHLHFGEISPRQIFHAVQTAAQQQTVKGMMQGAEHFLREMGWREFAHHLLFHFHQTPTQPLRAEFADFPWRTDAEQLAAWQHGRTGYPIVDAGMRELWHTGWMHNRVRMIVASFLVKDLLISWQTGAAWFWDTLVDADLANNTLGWQWTAGCGADAAPYFRIFNPVLQGKKFDGDGAYVRRWVPELAGLPDDCLHRPWEADAATLTAADVELGRTYPHPIVDHKAARDRALEALAQTKN